MPLDSSEELTYTEGVRSHTNGSGEVPMIVFLSFPNNSEKYRRVARVLRKRGLQVTTNFDESDLLISAQQKTDERLERIRKCDSFVFFAPGIVPEQWSPLRQAEFGYALGRERNIVFVGRTLNSLHRYGDVFDDINEFLSWYYSDQYLHYVAERYASGTRKASAA